MNIRTNSVRQIDYENAYTLFSSPDFDPIAGIDMSFVFATKDGLIEASRLKPLDEILTVDKGFQKIEAIRLVHTPGSNYAIDLSFGIYGMRESGLYVTPHQTVWKKVFCEVSEAATYYPALAYELLDSGTVTFISHRTGPYMQIILEEPCMIWSPRYHISSHQVD